MIAATTTTAAKSGNKMPFTDASQSKCLRRESEAGPRDDGSGRRRDDMRFEVSRYFSNFCCLFTLVVYFVSF